MQCLRSISDNAKMLLAGVGKSSLLLRFADNTFSGEFNVISVNTKYG